jgi:TatD DNase family protein
MSDHNPEESVQTRAVDTHCHLFLLGHDAAAAVDRARGAGVDLLVCAGIDPESSRRSVEFAESMRGVFATAGMHPHTASGFDAEAGAVIEELLSNPLVVAVGECGLDYFRMKSPADDQQRVFRAHVALSLESGTPLVVHTRDAWADILRLLDEGSAERVVFHCFSGDVDIATECAARGYFLSFATNVTYPKNEALRAASAAVPLDRILVETDSPFLAPQRIRGRDNEPANVLDAIDAIANARGEAFERVREATTANARAAFPRLR